MFSVVTKGDLYSHAWLELSRIKPVQFFNHDMESSTKTSFSSRVTGFVKLTCNVPFTTCKHTRINYVKNNFARHSNGISNNFDIQK